MSTPAFSSAGARSQSAGATTLTPALPSGRASPGIMLAVLTTKNNAVHNCSTSGWSLVGQQNSGASFTASLWIAQGNAAAPVFTWTGSVACSAMVMAYNDPTGVMHVGVGASTVNTGNTSPHSSSAIVTTQNNALVVYVDVSAANTALTNPGTYTSNVSSGSGTDAGHTDSGSKLVATAGTSSGAISTAGAAADWVELAVELYSTLAHFQTGRVALGVAVDTLPALATTRVAIGAVVLAPGDLMRTSRIAIGVCVALPETPNTRRRQSGVIN